MMSSAPARRDKEASFHALRYVPCVLIEDLPVNSVRNNHIWLTNLTLSKMTEKDTSTVKSYADSAVAAGQSLLGSITGNPVDKVSSTPPSQEVIAIIF